MENKSEYQYSAYPLPSSPSSPLKNESVPASNPGSNIASDQPSLNSQQEAIEELRKGQIEILNLIRGNQQPPEWKLQDPSYKYHRVPNTIGYPLTGFSSRVQPFQQPWEQQVRPDVFTGYGAHLNEANAHPAQPFANIPVPSPKNYQAPSSIREAQSPFSQFQAPGPVRNQRRETILERAMPNAEQFPGDYRRVLTTAQKFTGRLENIRSPWTLLAFCRVLEQFKAENPDQANQINVSAYVSDEVMNDLRIKFKTISVPEFKNTARVSNERFLQFLQECVKPTTQIKFYDVLSKTHFRERDLTATSFKPLYDSYILYEKDFIEVFHLCARNNDANVPLCHAKEYGLIYVYLNTFKPREFAWHIYQTELICNRYNTGNAVDDFLRFVSDFSAIMERLYVQGENARELNTTIGYAFRRGNNATSTPSRNESTPKTPTRSFSTPAAAAGTRTVPTRQNNSTAATSQNTRYSSGRVNHISVVDGDLDDDDIADDIALSMAIEQSELQAAQDSMESEQGELFQHDDTSLEDEETVHLYNSGNGHTSLSVMAPANRQILRPGSNVTRAPPSAANGQSADRSSLPCFNKMMHGTCTAVGCKFSHDGKILDNALTQMNARPWSKGLSSTGSGKSN